MSDILRIPENVTVEQNNFGNYEISWQCVEIIVPEADQAQTIVDMLVQIERLEKKPQFPTLLRKMWSGGEVQAWIDEHWGKQV